MLKGTNSVAHLLAALMVSFIVLPNSFTLFAQHTVLLRVSPEGVVYVNLTAPVEPGLNVLECPVEPIVVTLEALLDGTHIPVVYYDGAIAVVADREGTVMVNYVANISVEDSVAVLRYGSDSEAILVVPPTVVLLALPQRLTEARLEGNMLVIRFRGPANVSFVTVPPPVQTPTAPQPPRPEHPLPPSLMYALAIVIVLAGVAGGLLTRRRSIAGAEALHLSAVDNAILEALRKHGGEALQSVLQKELGIPRTTLWRHIRKLERLGYVAVERVDGVNKVRLLRKSP